MADTLDHLPVFEKTVLQEGVDPRVTGILYATERGEAE